MGFFRKIKNKIYSKLTRDMIINSIPELRLLIYNHERMHNLLDASWFILNNDTNNNVSKKARLFTPYHIMDTTIGDYSYVSINSYISQTNIGKFCSIGPNFLCGWGIHPTTAISTSPMFYSTGKQNGTSISKTNKIQERKTINIGNDVFIGANVVVLDGVTIGDGAIIGAGAVVSKDIPPYAIAVGSPIRIVKYRFDNDTITRLQSTNWWDWDLNKLKRVEQNFFNIEKFLENVENN